MKSIYIILPGVPKKSSGVWLNAEKKVLNLAISNNSWYMLDFATYNLAYRMKKLVI